MNVYIYDDDIVLRKSDGNVIVENNDMTLKKLPVKLIESVVVLGNTTLTCPLIKAFAENNIKVIYCTRSGKPVAVLNSFSSKNVYLKIKQVCAYQNKEFRLSLAKYICGKKIDSQREYLKKRRGIEKSYIKKFYEAAGKLKYCTGIDSLRGVEGYCAGVYFDAIANVAAFEKRTRRPATDCFNALLNLTYAMLQSKILSTLLSVGLDVTIGFIHEVKNGRASLALDVIEFFRTEADRFVINAFNRREFSEKDFYEENGGYYLNGNAFKKFIDKYTKEINADDEIYSVCAELVNKIIGDEYEDELLFDCI